MDKTRLKSENQTEGSLLRSTDILLHCLLAVLLLLIGTLGCVEWSIIWSTFIGMLIAAVGGIAIGVAAHRFLGNGRGNTEIFFGMFVTVGLGVLTIGYLYIVHIKGPMSTIGTLNRTVKQIFIFLEFLIAHISGIKLGKRFFS